MQKHFFKLLAIAFVFSCGTLDEEQLISPSKISDIPTEVSLEPIKGCNCTQTFTGSQNIEEQNWNHDLYYVAPNGSSGTIATNGLNAPPFPFTVPPSAFKTDENFRHRLIYTYDPSNPLLEEGFVTFTLSCNLAPPYSYTFRIPPSSGSNQVQIEMEAFGQITRDCGSVSRNEDAAD